MAQKVFGAGIFIQPSDQVGDGIKKLVFVGHRDVNDHLLAGFLDGTAHMIGHPFDHFKGEIFHNTVGLSDPVGIGQIQQVVRCHPQTYGLDIVGLHGKLHHSLPVGIGFQFGIKRCQGPVKNGGFKTLHFHILSITRGTVNRGKKRPACMKSSIRNFSKGEKKVGMP